MLSALVVGLISIGYNLCFVEVSNSLIIWINFLEKIFAFVVLSLGVSYFGYSKILKLNNQKSIAMFSLLVAIFLVGAEALTYNFTSIQASPSFLIRFLGAYVGINLVNFFQNK